MSVPRPAILVAMVTGAFLTSQGYDFRFLFVKFGVQDMVLDPAVFPAWWRYVRIFQLKSSPPGRVVPYHDGP